MNIGQIIVIIIFALSVPAYFLGMKISDMLSDRDM